ncbi:MAG TPA: cytochrome c peroxidase, partial [Polyangiaceae bacterium]
MGSRSSSGANASANTVTSVTSASRPPEAASPPVADTSSSVVTTDARITLGRKIFFDPALSEPAGTSCATCHDPAHGYAGNNGSEIGVARGSAP